MTLQEIIKKAKSAVRTPEIEDKLLIALMQYTFPLQLNAKAAEDITFSSRVGIGQNSTIEDFINGNNLSADGLVITKAAEEFINFVIDNCKVISFSSAFLDNRRGKKKKFHSYHEPESRPLRTNRLLKEIGFTSLYATIGGGLPGYVGTKILSNPIIAQNIDYNATTQSIIWGVFALGAGGIVLYRAFKYARDPRREELRYRGVFDDRELVFRDERVLSTDEVKFRPSEDRYSGEEVIYEIADDDLGSKIRKWSKKNPYGDLFKVSISDSKTKYTMWIVGLSIKTNEEHVGFKIYKAFEFDELPYRPSNTDLPEGYSIPARSFKPILNIEVPFLKRI